MVIVMTQLVSFLLQVVVLKANLNYFMFESHTIGVSFREALSLGLVKLKPEAISVSVWKCQPISTPVGV